MTVSSLKFKMQSFLSFGAAAALSAAVALLGAVAPAHAAQIDNDSRSAIPHDVQQLIVVDYRIMENSPAGMDLKARVLPPELKQLETALKASGLNENQDVEQLAFAAYRVGATGDNIKIVGLAQGQFQLSDIMANFQKKKIKPTIIRNNRLYPMGASGMLVTFLNPTTMLFGSSDAIKQGTQYMMHSLLGQASQLTDYESVRKRLLDSSYTMNFTNGVKFTLYVVTSDTITAATMSSLLNAAAMYEKVSGSAIEKQAIDSTTIDSTAGTLSVKFVASNSQFSSLLQSPLFQNVVR